MHAYRIDNQPFRPSRVASGIFRGALGASLCAALALGGCARYAAQPELNPGAWAPQAVQREWAPQPSQHGLVGSAAEAAVLSDHLPTGQRLGLTELIGYALQNSPSTRSGWCSAVAAAAVAGQARAPYYPVISAQSDSGYQRLVDLVPKHWGTLKTWQSRNLLSVDYDLIDFGRRDAAAGSALNELVTANLLFNRQVQEVVFDVERSFYELNAADAGVKAADATVQLATTDLKATELRQKRGLATAPEVLLARQRAAQADYDLENARLAVSLAQADLALALGVQANHAPEVALLKDQPLPPSLADDVDHLIGAAGRERPDLAAKLSTVRARQAEVDLAHASLYPTLKLTSFYGEQAFNYTLSNPATPMFTAMAPEYGAGVSLKWDLFSGFSHVNSIKQAEARRDAARADFESAELDVAANVWRAYFTYQTAQRKYEYSQALLAASQSSYKSNFRSYALGLATIIDLLSAERELAAARFTIIQSKAELLISAATVTFATGAIPSEAKP